MPLERSHPRTGADVPYAQQADVARNASLRQRHDPKRGFSWPSQLLDVERCDDQLNAPSHISVGGGNTGGGSLPGGSGPFGGQGSTVGLTHSTPGHQGRGPLIVHGDIVIKWRGQEVGRVTRHELHKAMMG